jgi:hypothetical protein
MMDGGGSAIAVQFNDELSAGDHAGQLERLVGK